MARATRGSLAEEQISEILAILASAQNPDGTTYVLPVDTSGTAPASVANILSGQQVFSASGGPTTIITIPANRTWAGVVSVNCDVAVAAAAATAGLARGDVTIAGAGATPSPGQIFSVAARAGANAVTGAVGSQGNNYGSTSLVVAAAGAGATIQLTATIAGTNGEVIGQAIGALQ